MGGWEEIRLHGFGSIFRILLGLCVQKKNFKKNLKQRKCETLWKYEKNREPLGGFKTPC